MFTRNKFRARRTNGFASALENAVHEKLLEREKLGEVRNIRCQSQVTLINCDECGTTIRWKIDFKFEEATKFTGIGAHTVWNDAYAEAKGVETADYKKKIKIWRELKPAKLYIYKGTWRRPVVVEVIE